jgi:hypothetical protein
MTAVNDVTLPMGLAGAISAEEGRQLLTRDSGAVTAETVAALQAAGTALGEAGDHAGAEDLADWAAHARALVTWRLVLSRPPTSAQELAALVAEAAPDDRFFDLGVERTESALAEYARARSASPPDLAAAARALEWASQQAAILRVIADQTAEPGHQARAGYAAAVALIAPSTQAEQPEQADGDARDQDAMARARPLFRHCADEQQAPDRLRFESLRYLAWIAGRASPGEVAGYQAAAEALLESAPKRDLAALRAVRGDRAWWAARRGDDAEVLRLHELNLADTERALFTALAGNYAEKVTRGSGPDYTAAIDACLRLAEAAPDHAAPAPDHAPAAPDPAEAAPGNAAPAPDRAAPAPDRAARILELAEAGKARAFAHALATQAGKRDSSPFLTRRRGLIEAELERLGALLPQLPPEAADGSRWRMGQLLDAIGDNEQRRLAGGTVTRDLRLLQPRTAEEIRGLVPPGGAFLSYHWAPSRLVISVVREDGLAGRPVRVDIPADELAGDRVTRAAFFLHDAIYSRGDFTAPDAIRRLAGERMEEFWPEQFQHYLHEQLITPVADRIADCGTLVISPHGPLRNVPFHALLDRDGSALIDRHAVAYTNGALLLAAARERRRTGLRTCFAAGTGAAADGPAAARDEAAAVAAAFGATPAPATTAAVLGEGTTADVLHLASHADGTTALSATFGLVLDDGTLTQQQIARASFRASIVTLSACPSAAVDVDPIVTGTEMNGLVGAFLRAGVPLVAATLWPLSDRVARPFSERFYAALTGGGTAAEALRAAQRAVRSDRRFSHPYYWAPFTLWGDATAPLGTAPPGTAPPATRPPPTKDTRRGLA